LSKESREQRDEKSLENQKRVPCGGGEVNCLSKKKTLKAKNTKGSYVTVQRGGGNASDSL